MKLFPAVDVKGGQVVRLRQGDMAQATVYGDSPADQAARFVQAGAAWVHLIDLDGAIGGTLANPAIGEAVARARAMGAKAQCGGGIRSMASIEALLDAGANRVMLGTKAALDGGRLLRAAAKAFPGQIAAALDARGGRVAVAGWVEEGPDIALTALARRYEDAGASWIFYTNIARDGVGEGPDIAAAQALRAAVSLPIALAGGVRHVADVRAARAAGLDGLVAGRALYDGSLDLAEALAAC